MGVDARKTLRQLNAEWDDCQKCNLGARRNAMGFPVMHGQGTPGRILLVGGGPSRSDEWTGDPFSDDQGPKLIYGLLDSLGLLEHCYYTHVVACRSCVPDVDPTTGAPRLRKQGGVLLPVFNDAPPTTAQIDACRPRLMEEIYLVDPVVIIGMGGVAVSALLGKQTSITSVLGKPQTIEIPGAGETARITDKKKAWGRKVNGEMIYPTDQSQVKYLMVPTYDPLFIKLNADDKTNNSVGRLYANHLRLVQRMYAQYVTEAELPIKAPEVIQGADHDEEDQD